jgi:hypothetical protein
VAKSIYLTVCKKGDPFAVQLKKQFFNASEYNKFVKDKDFQEKYPETEFRYVKEVY